MANKLLNIEPILNIDKLYIHENSLNYSEIKNKINLWPIYPTRTKIIFFTNIPTNVKI